MTSLELVAYGRPAPQGSKQFGASGQAYEQSRYLGEHPRPDGRGGSGWRKDVYLAAQRARIAAKWRTVTMPCALSLAFWVARPKRPDPDRPWLDDYPAGPPDVDKLARAVADCLTRAGVWADDALWVRTHQLDKGYCAPTVVTDAPVDWWSRHPMGATGAYIKVTQLSELENDV